MIVRDVLRYMPVFFLIKQYKYRVKIACWKLKSNYMSELSLATSDVECQMLAYTEIVLRLHEPEAESMLQCVQRDGKRVRPDLLH